MARLLAFTYGEHFGDNDLVLIEAINAWPAGDKWMVMLNASHPGLSQYQEKLGERAEVVAVTMAKDRTAGSASALERALAVAMPDAALVNSAGYPPSAEVVEFLELARQAGAARVVLAVHNDPYFGDDGPLRALWRQNQGNRAAGLADELVAVSRDSAARISQACRRPVTVVLDGIAPPTAPPVVDELKRALGVPPRAPLIGAIANFVPRKGLRSLLYAFTALAPDRPQAHLVLIGAPADPEETAVLKKIAAESPAAKRIIFAGTPPDPRRFAAAFDVLAVPSIEFESFGLAALVAMQAGKPVVASKVGGLPEVVTDGETGLLVPPGDSSALALALARLLDDPALAKSLGEKGRVRAGESFTAVRMAAEYRAILMKKAVPAARNPSAPKS